METDMSKVNRLEQIRYIKNCVDVIEENQYVLSNDMAYKLLAIVKQLLDYVEELELEVKENGNV